MRWMVRLVFLTVAFLAYRELQHRREAVMEMGNELNGELQGIHGAETEMDSTDRSVDDADTRVQELDAKITAIEHEHPGGVSGSARPEYESLVAERNNAAAIYNDFVARQRRLHDDYRGQVDRHNARVAEVNTYAASTGPCSLLPEWIRARFCSDRVASRSVLRGSPSSYRQ